MSRARELRRHTHDHAGMVVEPRGEWVQYGPAAKVIRELEADKARLDWLADKNNKIGNVQLPTKCVERNITSLRDAIDDAMECQ